MVEIVDLPNRLGCHATCYRAKQTFTLKRRLRSEASRTYRISKTVTCTESLWHDDVAFGLDDSDIPCVVKLARTCIIILRKYGPTNRTVFFPVPVITYE